MGHLERLCYRYVGLAEIGLAQARIEQAHEEGRRARQYDARPATQDRAMSHSLRGPLTPPLAKQGPQGLSKRPDDNTRPKSVTHSMPMRHDGSSPCGTPSKTPRPGK